MRLATPSVLDFFGFESRDDALDAARSYWNPLKVDFWLENGIPMMIGERQGYELVDVDGHRVLDVHLNGGTYNLGHRNPELVKRLTEALQILDVGNHHFPSAGRAALSRALVRSVDTPMSKVVFASAGGEAIDVAIKSARWATGRRKIVTLVNAYHGNTGLSVAAGDPKNSAFFLSDRPDEFAQVPLNDLPALDRALSGDDVAAVMIETIPATAGFPLPEAGYLSAAADAAAAHGSLYIADEVQVGLGRTGSMWAYAKHGVTPDIVVTGKGLGGGLYPVAAAVLNDRAAGWLLHDGMAHNGTFAGAELGCAVATEVLRITSDPATQTNVIALSEQFAEGLDAIRRRHPMLLEVRQDGLVMGLRFDGPRAAVPVMRELYRQGVWAIAASYDLSVLQFKPGLLLSSAEADNILDILDSALRALR
jgi:acetylornithine/succinyldiaminopimelate/putrescine aminotransferase